MKQKQSKPAAYFDVPAMNTTAVASQFKQVCEDVANAIREQKGSTDKILPKDFSSEIRSISGRGNSKYAPRYFKIDWDVASEDWKIIVSGTLSNDYYDHTPCIANLIKLNLPYEDKIFNIVVTPLSVDGELPVFVDYLIAFSYQPIISLNVEETEGVNIMTFEENIETINSKLGWKYNLTMEGITEITEEEFYNF